MNGGGPITGPGRERHIEAKRTSRRRFRLGFAARLAVTLALTLALVSGLGYQAMTVYLQDRVFDQEALYDRSVVVGAIEETGARAVLLAMATFANETGSFVIAEGIEDEHVLHFVRSLTEDLTVARPRIHGGQGYGLGRPAPSMPPTRSEALTRPNPQLTAA